MVKGFHDEAVWGSAHPLEVLHGVGEAEVQEVPQDGQRRGARGEPLGPAGPEPEPQQAQQQADQQQRGQHAGEREGTD